MLEHLLARIYSIILSKILIQLPNSQLSLVRRKPARRPREIRPSKVSVKGEKDRNDIFNNNQPALRTMNLCIVKTIYNIRRY